MKGLDDSASRFLSSGERVWSSSHSNEVLRKLNRHYQTLHNQILQYQGPILGLFPESTVNDGRQRADIRVSLYCATACWALSLAYKKIDDDRGRSHELGQSSVKCMRGILYCWLKQADKIERFKNNQCPSCALHNHFDMSSGEACYAKCFNHLQIDVISLFLLMLVQMTASGLEIVHTTDEVNFIQNMIFYIERAYRTPDFGIWERGTKYNVGERELHASSIGMAKTALEAISGFNMFGTKGAAWSVIFVDIDAHNRNRTIFDTILPRESNSKNTDAGLLTTVSWPAFAVHDQNLRDRTIDKCTRKLEGLYGFKRYLRDGLGCISEDPTVKFYRSAELKNFDGVECEWPIFFCYRIIDGLFKRDDDMVNAYWEKLETCITHTHQGDLIPKYYYVAERGIALERAHPGSQPRLPSEQGSKEGNVFLWGQSIYFIAQLIGDKVLSSIDIDPIRRSLPAVNRPKFHVRYSSFQGVASDLVIQIALIAESVRLQQMLATFGILAQTPHEIDPIQIWSPNTLTQVHQTLGVNEKLGLSGRPSRPWGVLSTSKIYRINGRTVVCYPLIFEQSDFYHSQDMALVLDDVIVQIEFLANRWRLDGRPTFVMIIREENIKDPNVKKFFDLLAGLKAGRCGDVKVRTGRLQSFISSACIEHLDFVRSIPEELGIKLKTFQEIDVGSNFRSLTNLSKVAGHMETPHEEMPNKAKYNNMSYGELLEILKTTDNLKQKAMCLHVLSERHTLIHNLDDKSIEETLVELGHKAGVVNDWLVARYCASLLRKIVDSLAPSITTVLVRGKQVTVGIARHEEKTIDMPMPPDDIKAIIYDKGPFIITTSYSYICDQIRSKST